MDAEIWKPIPGCEETHEVSDIGRVKSLFFRNRYMKISRDRIHKEIIGRDGRPLVSVNGKWCRVHRVVASAFHPNPENKPEVNHKDGNPQNNRADNLEWVTRRENMLHAFATGLNVQTTQKIYPQRIREIRQAIASNTGTQIALAASLGITPKVLSKIKLRQIYMHVS